MIRKGCSGFPKRSCADNALEGTSSFKHLIGMAVDLDVAPHLGHAPVGPNQNRGPNDSEESSAIHRLFTPGAIRLEHLMLLIRNQRNGQLVLVAERFLCLPRIRRYAEDGR